MIYAQLVCFYFILTVFMTVGFGGLNSHFDLENLQALILIYLAGDIYALNQTERVSF
jgi:hypothetical protein